MTSSKNLPSLLVSTKRKNLYIIICKKKKIVIREQGTVLKIPPTREYGDRPQKKDRPLFPFLRSVPNIRSSVNHIIYIREDTIFFRNVFQKFFINFIIFYLVIQFCKTTDMVFNSFFSIINHSTISDNK